MKPSEATAHADLRFSTEVHRLQPPALGMAAVGQITLTGQVQSSLLRMSPVLEDGSDDKQVHSVPSLCTMPHHYFPAAESRRLVSRLTRLTHMTLYEETRETTFAETSSSCLAWTFRHQLA